MTKVAARQVLGVEEGCDTSDLKRAYRRLSFEYHPDRLDESKSNGEVNFEQIKLAYETLSSGVRGQEGVSWYESLGGKDRTEFNGPVSLISRAVAEELLGQNEVSCGVVGIESDVVQSFVARNLRSV